MVTYAILTFTVRLPDYSIQQTIRQHDACVPECADLAHEALLMTDGPCHTVKHLVIYIRVDYWRSFLILQRLFYKAW